MSTLDEIGAWSGWILSVLGAFATVASMRSARREKARSEALTTTLTRIYAAPDVAVPAGSAAARDERVRATLIRAASNAAPLRTVLATCAAEGTTSDDVLRVARELRDRGLLAFADPIGPETALDLNR